MTPFHADGSINYSEYQRLLEYLVENGIHGLFVCGTTGEFINLTIEERKKILEKTMEIVPKEVNVMYNTTAMNLRQIEELLDWADKCGVDTVSFTSPYYHRYDASALTAYFQTVSKLAKGKNVYLYNMPGMTNNPITPQILKAVEETCPNVRGIKDSSMDFMVMLNYQSLLQNDTFELITGNDAQVLTALQAGAAGGVIATASVFPALCMEIWDKFYAGDLEGARRAQDKVLRLREMFRGVMPVMSHKQALNLQGFDMGPARFPFRDLRKEEAARVESTLRTLELI